jgi:hypothetical protein
MTWRARVLLAGLWLPACQMNNPAFDGSDDDVADLGEGTGDTLDSGELGESVGESDSTSESTSEGMDDVDTSSSDNPDGTSSTTDADCTPGTPCGACHVCDEQGACVPDVGADCDGDVLHCGDYLFGSEEGICYRLAETALLGSCSEQGECKAPSAGICPMVKGEVHFACDPVCVTDPLGCAPGAFAADVDMAAMCVIQGFGPGCHPTCSNENNSVVQQQTCSFGECMFAFQQICNPYACNPETVTCFGACENDLECAQGFTCQDFDCVMP